MRQLSLTNGKQILFFVHNGVAHLSFPDLQSMMPQNLRQVLEKILTTMDFSPDDAKRCASHISYAFPVIPSSKQTAVQDQQRWLSTISACTFITLTSPLCHCCCPCSCHSVTVVLQYSFIIFNAGVKFCCSQVERLSQILRPLFSSIRPAMFRRCSPF